MGSGVSVEIPPEFTGLSEETQQELTTAFLALKAEGKGDQEILEILISKQPKPHKQILLTELLDTINEIVSRGKTPLIIDDSEVDKVSATKLHTLFSFSLLPTISSHILVSKSRYYSFGYIFYSSFHLISFTNHLPYYHSPAANKYNSLSVISCPNPFLPIIR